MLTDRSKIWRIIQLVLGAILCFVSMLLSVALLVNGQYALAFLWVVIAIVLSARFAKQISQHSDRS